jgi:hypothetical protein
LHRIHLRADSLQFGDYRIERSIGGDDQIETFARRDERKLAADAAGRACNDGKGLSLSGRRLRGHAELR